MWITEATLSHSSPTVPSPLALLSLCLFDSMPAVAINSALCRLVSWLQSKSKVSSMKNVNKKRAPINIAARMLATLKNQAEWNAVQNGTGETMWTSAKRRNRILFTLFQIQCTVSPTWWHWAAFSGGIGGDMTRICMYKSFSRCPLHLPSGPLPVALSKWRLQLEQNNMFVSLILWVGRVAYTIFELPNKTWLAKGRTRKRS